MGDVVDIRKSRKGEPLTVPECGTSEGLATEGWTFVYEGYFETREFGVELQVFLFLLADGNLHVYQRGLGINSQFYNWTLELAGLAMMPPPSMLLGFLESCLGFKAVEDDEG